MIQKQDVVLLHGWGMNNGVWGHIAPKLANLCPVVCIDLPGHGENCYQGEHGLDEWVDRCLERAPAQAHWVGWSLGGLLATRAALRQPGRVLSLTLTASAPRFTRGKNWPNAMPDGTLAEFNANLHSDYPGTLHRFLALQVRGSEQGRETLRMLKKELCSRPPARLEALQEGLRLLRETDLCAEIGKLTMPAQWIFGERDVLVPVAVTEDLALLLPGKGRVVRIPGAGHAPFLSHPEMWLPWVEGFLSCHQ